MNRFKVEKNNCTCHPETCPHWYWYVVSPSGKRLGGSDDHATALELANELDDECKTYQLKS